MSHGWKRVEMTRREIWSHRIKGLTAGIAAGVAFTLLTAWLT